jgi:hypothetical protein
MKLFDYYNTGEDTVVEAYTDPDMPFLRYQGQTFTPAEDFTLSRINLYLSKWGIGSLGNIYLGIRNTTLGKPAGVSLLSHQINSDSLPVYPTYAWTAFDVGQINLLAGTMYAWTLQVSDGGIANSIQLKTDVSSPSYAGGTRVQATNLVWSIVNTDDILFELWGYGTRVIYSSLAGNRPPSVIKTATRFPSVIKVATRTPSVIQLSTR